MKLEILKNKIILKLLKTTHLHALTIYAFIAKTYTNDLFSYIKGYEDSSLTDEQKYNLIFNKS